MRDKAAPLPQDVILVLLLSRPNLCRESQRFVKPLPPLRPNVANNGVCYGPAKSTRPVPTKIDELEARGVAYARRGCAHAVCLPPPFRHPREDNFYFLKRVRQGNPWLEADAPRG